jgi:ferredoxin
MHSELNAQLAFRLTGMRSAGQLEGVEALALRPALLAGYRDLTRLRYDFPLVFTADVATPLSALVDEALANNADAELRAKALRREREMRQLLAGGGKGKLSELWNLNLEIKTDGDLADCDAALPRRFVEHAWSGVQAKKARRFRERAEKLALQLAGILAADFVHSDEGRSAEKLAAALASPDDSIDARAMSRLLSKALPEHRLPESRRRRIQSLLSVIKGQRFFAGEDSYAYVFEDCTAALHALNERRPRLVELGKAMAAAELETAGEYVEARHDPLFEVFGDVALDPELCPDYLVCVNAAELHARKNAGLQLLLASGMPVKVLVQHDDILERTPIQGLAFGTHARMLAGMALGLNNVYVVQSSASNLPRLAEKIVKGVQYRGVALFSVFSGAAGQSESLPPYLVAAAAMESRAFPAFTYDPSAGDDYAARFSLENNPQPEADWAQHEFAYEDAEHQRMSEMLAFTLTDFAACDRRYAGFFARIPQGQANGQAPSLLMVDGENRLQKVIASEPVLRETQRCLDNWHHLQSLVQRKAAPAPAPAPVAEKPAAAAPASAPAAAEEVKKAPASDEPYIETPRCTTCEECMKINNKLFVYDANKQAYLADPKLGSYKDLVEAAENCQVSIIHPGKPLNPDEPGLDELLKRAEPFL